MKIMKIKNLFLIIKNNMRHFTFLFACLCSLLTWAQSGQLFNTDNQLSSNLVTQVFQDSNGFIWITTRNGLNVYDGYNFTVTKKTNNGKGELNTNYLNCITQDKLGRIIVGTNKGLLRYDGNLFQNIPLPDSKGKFITTYVTSICNLSNGDLYIGTSGFGLYKLKINEEKCQRIQGTDITLKYISRIMQDQKGNVWIVTENGILHKMDTKGKLSSNVAGTKGLNAQEIKEDKNGTLYLATKGQGLYLKKAYSSIFTKVDGIGNDPIESLYISKNGRIFLGYDGLGITVYNPQTGNIINNPFFSAQTNLSKSKVQNIIEDSQGNIWISMMQKGVFMQPQGLYDFGYIGFRLGNRNIIGDNSVTSVFLDSHKNLWIGTDKDGLYKLSHNGREFLAHYMEGCTVLSICEDTHGRIWAGTYTEGVGFLNAAGQFQKIDIKGMGNAGVFDIISDHQGNIWLATMGAGLVKISAVGEPIIYKVKNHADENHQTNCIPNDYIAKLAFSKDEHRLYLATSIGLACLDLLKNSWTSAFGGVNCINKGSFSHCVFVDNKDHVWYGTEDGAYHYTANGRLIKHYTTTDGLTDNSIASIIEDCKGRIWFGTTGGMSKLDIAKGKFTNFFVENGVQSNEFSDGAACTSSDKRIIIMGGTGGFNYFDAIKVKQHPWKATVNLTGFFVGNKRVRPGVESGNYMITDKWVFISKKFDLSHEDNSFTLQLSTLTYSNVEQISYAYSVNGEDWRYVSSGQNEISFSHMPHGSYKFRIKAICNGYETPIKEFEIVIHPAWYASMWAKAIYLLAFISFVILFMRHHKRKEEDRLILQQHIHAEEMGEAKLRFFMNISHEIRTPLTLILTPLLSLIKEDKDPHRQGIYDLMRKNSERILHLINQMMDLRKIDKGQMAMHMSETDMVSFINDEHKLFEQQALAKHITFSFAHDCEKLPVWIDRNNFDKVLMNVLSNAFKFTPTGGKIKMSLTHTEHHARISIKDSGKGIDKDKLETIFQRFYQSPTNPNDRNVGTGIGLDLTRSLVELHYGTIIAHNNAEANANEPQATDDEFKTGSEFIITLPLGKEHLKPEEIIEEQVEENVEQEIQESEEEANEETRDMEENASETAKTSSKKSTIALVEDEDEILNYLKSQLSNDFNIITFHNGKEALPEIIKQTPDLVISDIMMPEMDGNTLCAKIKGNLNTNHIPVILLTAKSREEDQLEGLSTGADAYIVKPFNMDILRRTILNILSVRRTLRNKFTGQESQDDKVEQLEIQSPDEALMERIMDVINKNLSDSDLSVDMIAKQVGISRVHLHRKMKELTNQTPHSFIRNIRLKQAAKMLKESNNNVTDVMYICGFSNAASFSTMFKNLYGCSPREYKNQH